MSLLRSKHFVVCLILLLFLLQCAFVYADDDFSFFRSRGGGGTSGPMSTESLVESVLGMGVVFCIAGVALFFLHIWLTFSFIASKIAAALVLFSFLAWPLLVFALLPPVFSFWAGAWFFQEVWIDNPNGGIALAFLLPFAAMLYFYLLNLILAMLTSALWGKRIFRAVAVLSILCCLGGSLFMGGMILFLFFLLCTGCAWLAGKTHEKVSVRLARRVASP